MLYSSLIVHRPCKHLEFGVFATYNSQMATQLHFDAQHWSSQVQTYLVGFSQEVSYIIEPAREKSTAS